MKVQTLGHVVLKVRNLQRSEDFYSGTLGMRVISRLPDPPMTFFTLETTENSRSVHVLDPDGNEIELYVDISGDRPVGTS